MPTEMLLFLGKIHAYPCGMQPKSMMSLPLNGSIFSSPSGSSASTATAHIFGLNPSTSLPMMLFAPSAPITTFALYSPLNVLTVTYPSHSSMPVTFSPSLMIAPAPVAFSFKRLSNLSLVTLYPTGFPDMMGRRRFDLKLKTTP